MWNIKQFFDTCKQLSKKDYLKRIKKEAFPSPSKGRGEQAAVNDSSLSPSLPQKGKEYKVAVNDR